MARARAKGFAAGALEPMLAVLVFGKRRPGLKIHPIAVDFTSSFHPRLIFKIFLKMRGRSLGKTGFGRATVMAVGTNLMPAIRTALFGGTAALGALKGRRLRVPSRSEVPFRGEVSVETTLRTGSKIPLGTLFTPRRTVCPIPITGRFKTLGPALGRVGTLAVKGPGRAGVRRIGTGRRREIAETGFFNLNGIFRNLDQAQNRLPKRPIFRR
jgi:hypothetical protein